MIVDMPWLKKQEQYSKGNTLDFGDIEFPYNSVGQTKNASLPKPAWSIQTFLILTLACDRNLTMYNYPHESNRIWFYRRWFVSLSVCVSVSL